MDSIYSLTRDELIDWFVANGQKKFRATQVWEWLYRKRVDSFDEMTNLSVDLREFLKANFVLETMKIDLVQVASDGTTKFLLRLADGNLIETVLMVHDYGLSVCVTTQVGCNIGCTFCASGLLTKKRDLTAGEIVEEIMTVQKYFDRNSSDGGEKRVSHVVVMGIGEPFDNYQNVMNFIDIINSDHGLAIGARHITVSTSGLIPMIREFAKREKQVNLAISLHAPNDELRTRLMPVNKAYPLKDLMEALWEYARERNRRVTFEYIMINGVNDTPELALELAALLAANKKLAYVNLIPYNAVDEHDQYQRSSKTSIEKFHNTLHKKGINAIVRREHGDDIDAACGQLRSKQMKLEGDYKTCLNKGAE
ncbi:MAG: 23S rRNA (adenine(2503)-C(2))-methyltransferase RlmN [Lactobacillales bacterium]|jgi:23S rRNA (adenine2503-C2)-methyltransferase|nr:23S rRNA (adenine(2503)-C(2))-methyltransferase RlmN [Lactobacillales bacterium]